MDFVGIGQPLTRRGLSEALDTLGLEPGDAAFIWAVVEAETASVTQGFGFRADRRPQVLFERHVFRRETAGRFDAQAPDVSGQAGGYGSLQGQFERLDKAIALCEGAGLTAEAAIRSASWGMGQVMGFNHAAAGFASAANMVEAMKQGEDAQLAGMSRFLLSSGSAKALAAKDWVKFSKEYNGKNYWEHHYDVKLAVQYQRFASGSLPNLEVRTAQAALVFLGFSPGRIDGVIGPRTRGALASFRLTAGLSAGADELDGPTYKALCAKAGFTS